MSGPDRTFGAWLRELLVAHARRYPLWGVEDLYKLLHQAALGSEHAIPSEAEARRRLARELAEMGPGPDEPLVDPISVDGSIARVHLRPYVRSGSAPERLVEAFLRTASEVRGSASSLESGLADAAKLAGGGLITLDPEEIRLLAARMKASDFPAVHHSAAYAAAYRPAYRVAARAFLREDAW